MGLESLKRLYICVSDTQTFGDVVPTVHVMVLQHLTNYSGPQTCNNILWWAGQCETLSSNGRAVRWGTSGCSTLCTSFSLRSVGLLLPPLSLVSLHSKHGWGPPGGTRNIYREGVVRELEVKWSTWWCGKKGDSWRQDDWQRIWSAMDRHGQTEYVCLQNLPTRQSTCSILAAQPCRSMKVLTWCVLARCRVGLRTVHTKLCISMQCITATITEGDT